MNYRPLTLLLATVFALAHAPPSAASDSDCDSFNKLREKQQLDAKGGSALVASRQLEQLCKKIGLQAAPIGAPSVFEVLKGVFAVERSRTDRLKPTAPPGMPVGVVMPVGGKVVLDYSAVAVESVTAVAVDGPRLQLRQGDAGSGSVSIAAEQLQPAQDYKWVLRTRRQVYDGTFSIPDAQKTERVQARLKQLPTLSDNPITLLVLEAAIYDDEDMYGARDATVAKLRRELQ